MEYLTVTEVLLLHARLIQDTGGSSGIRDMSLLESALARPQVTFDGVDLYPDLWAKAASLMHSLIQNHPFMDGNKRTAFAAAGIMIEVNGYTLTAGNDEVPYFCRQIALKEMTLDEMAAWLRAHSYAQEELEQ